MCLFAAIISLPVERVAGDNPPSPLALLAGMAEKAMSISLFLTVLRLDVRITQAARIRRQIHKNHISHVLLQALYIMKEEDPSLQGEASLSIITSKP